MADPDITSATDETADDLALDVALPTFAILARFRESAASAEGAVDAVTRRLLDSGQRTDHVVIERQDDDGSWLVMARFVTVSVDAHTAVAGVHEDLHGAGLTPDEVWAERQVA